MPTRVALGALILLAVLAARGAGARTAAQTDAEAMAGWMAAARQRPSVAGPLSGDLVHSVGAATVVPAGVDLRDFYAHVRFVNPVDAAVHPWDYGFAFRDRGGADHYRLVVDSGGAWSFSVEREPALATGSIANLDTGAGGSNELDLVVVGDVGYFAVNGEYVATLDTSRLAHGGEVWIGTAFRAANTVAGATTRYQDFAVWELDAGLVPAATPRAASPTPAREATPQATPVATVRAESAARPDPAAQRAFEAVRAEALRRPSVGTRPSGELVERVDRVSIVPAGVDVRDFYARVRLENPRDPADHPWDYGFVFRDTGGAGGYQLIVRSDGLWALGSGRNLVAGGTVPGLRTGAGQVNTLELIVVGESGLFAVNGNVVGALDVSAHTDSGDVAVAAAFLTDDTVEGATTRFREFGVWSLDGVRPEPPAATPEAGTATDQVAVQMEESAGSGVSALAVLTARDDRTEVALSVLGATGDELAVIHEGTCATLDPAPAFLLRDPDATGKSLTTLNVPLAELRAAPHAIALHASAANFATVVACGEIPTA